MLTGGAVLRVAGRVFLGWGASTHPDDRQAEEARAEGRGPDEVTAGRDWTPPLMLIVPTTLLLAVLAIGLIPGAVPAIETAASHFHDHSAYLDWVLHGTVKLAPSSTSHVETFDYLYAIGAVLGAVAVAALALFGNPLRSRTPDSLVRPVQVAVQGLRRLHSGHIGDYIAWWTAGAAAFGAISLLLLL
jgi:multicomponent Na+:H+ antiporter subunit D